MTNWIKHALTLTGKTVDLISLDKAHLEELRQLAKEKRIWEFYTLDCSDAEKFDTSYEEALTEKESGTQYPFVIYLKKEKKLIGSTRFLDMQEKNLKLEIGWTWLHPDHWATAVNLECKLLLLTFCFEELKTRRVQFKTDENNLRSRKAIEKVGGKFEGILRNDMVRDNGTKRNSALFSIIDTEWDNVKTRLNELYRLKQKTKSQIT